MIDYKVEADLKTVHNIVAKFEKYDSNLQAQLQKILSVSALKIRKNAVKNITENKTIDTGRLRSSIQLYENERGLTAGVGTNVNYAGAIEYGSPPHEPPLDALKLWVKRKGIKKEGKNKVYTHTDSEAASVAFLVQRKISKYGTKARPFLYPAFNSEKQDYINNIKKTLGDAFK